ncbi:MAG TPA: hypothetical protein VE195_10005 [Acidobacteriaceae bacterium]|nr:hypothetical protein [Acidobacteriaceae bacterium]
MRSLVVAAMWRESGASFNTIETPVVPPIVAPSLAESTYLIFGRKTVSLRNIRICTVADGDFGCYVWNKENNFVQVEQCSDLSSGLR